MVPDNHDLSLSRHGFARYSADDLPQRRTELLGNSRAGPAAATNELERNVPMVSEGLAKEESESI